MKRMWKRFTAATLAGIIALSSAGLCQVANAAGRGYSPRLSSIGPISSGCFAEWHSNRSSRLR